MGQDVTYSGTVWAALEGNLMGIPSFAVSLADDRYSDYRPAARFAERTARWIMENSLPEDTIFNINVQGTITGQTRIRGVDDGEEGHGNGLIGTAEEFYRSDDRMALSKVQNDERCI